jgi:hypothetical protein
MRACILLVCRYDGMFASYPYHGQEAERRRLRKRADCDQEQTEKGESRGCAGAGVYKYANGDVYEGEFMNDNFNGRGTRGGGGRGCSVSGSVGRVTGQENQYESNIYIYIYIYIYIIYTANRYCLYACMEL